MTHEQLFKLHLDAFKSTSPYKSLNPFWTIHSKKRLESRTCANPVLSLKGLSGDKRIRESAKYYVNRLPVGSCLANIVGRDRHIWPAGWCNRMDRIWIGLRAGFSLLILAIAKFIHKHCIRGTQLIWEALCSGPLLWTTALTHCSDPLLHPCTSPLQPLLGATRAIIG